MQALRPELAMKIGLGILLAVGVSAQAAAQEPEAARAMIRFFTAPAAAPVRRAMGVEPFME